MKKCVNCGTPVTFANLSAWDEGDGQVHCTAHGPLAERFEEETNLSMIEGLLLMIVLMASIVAFKEYLAREAGLK